jgi:hypothetical protein
VARRFPPEGKVTYVWGRNGAMDVVLDVAVPHGKSTRDVRVPIEPEFIIALAAALDCCPEHIGEWLPTGSVVEGTFKHRGQWVPHANVGHAVWHLQHPDRPRPCLPHDGRPVIDVADETKLPPGDVIDVGDEQ